MDKEKYFKGKGLDLSENPFLAQAEFYYAPLDGLYKPSKEYCEEFDYVYSKDYINKSRFFPIALHEFFALPKVGGNIILEFTNTNKKKFIEIREKAKHIYSDRAKIIYSYSKDKYHFLVIKKLKPAFSQGDSIDKWTFGFLTRRGSEEPIKKIIESIRKLKIPQYEIIFCGHSNLDFSKYPDASLIYFDKHDDRGWITKKRNLICEQAKYENLFLAHDHIALHPDFYKGFVKYGNYFDVLFVQSIVQKTNLADKQWTTWSFGYDSILHKNWVIRTYTDIYAHSELDKRDWNKYAGVQGYVEILKKRVWKKVKWDEKLHWGEGEDYAWNKELYKAGIIIRNNPQSHIIHLKARFEDMKYPFLDVRREFRLKKLGRPNMKNLFKAYFLIVYEHWIDKRKKQRAAKNVKTKN